MNQGTPELLAKEVASLVARLRQWTPARWAAAVEPWGTRADLGRHLAQSLAAAAAVLEGQPVRALPVLADLLVPDQVAITGDDLVRGAPTSEVVDDVVAHVLLHRYDLLSEEPPPSLGGAAALLRGQSVCTTPA